MTSDDDTPDRVPTARFARLPERVKPEDMVEEHDTVTPLPIDPGGREAELYAIRHLIG